MEGSQKLGSPLARFGTPERRRRKREDDAPQSPKQMPDIQWIRLDLAKTDKILKELRDAKETYVGLRQKCDEDEGDNRRHEVDYQRSYLAAFAK